MSYYFYQLNRRTWKVMDNGFHDVGRSQVVHAALSEVQNDLISY